MGLVTATSVLLQGQVPSCICTDHPTFFAIGLFRVSDLVSIEIEALNEEEYSILRNQYCYSLQQRIFLAFCDDSDTLSHVPMDSS